MFGTLFLILCFCKAVLFQEVVTHVDVQIIKINENQITGICFCSSPPYGHSAEFLIDNITVASISLINNVCYIKRRPCETNECSCTSTVFNMTFMMPEEIASFALTCQVRVLQKKLHRHLKVFTTKTFNGKDVIGENTYIEQISFANGGDSTQLNTNSTKGSLKNTYIYIIVGTLIPVTSILTTVLILSWRRIKERTKSDSKTDIESEVDEERNISDKRTETEPVSIEDIEDGVGTSSLVTNNESNIQEEMSVTSSLTSEQEDITTEVIGSNGRTETDPVLNEDGVGTSKLPSDNQFSTREVMPVSLLTCELEDIKKGQSHEPLGKDRIYYAMSTFRKEHETDDEPYANDYFVKTGNLSEDSIISEFFGSNGRTETDPVFDEDGVGELSLLTNNKSSIHKGMSVTPQPIEQEDFKNGQSHVPLDSNKIYYAMSSFKKEIETDDESDENDCLIKSGNLSDDRIISDEPPD